MSKIVAVSGAFDPIHDGHIALFKEAAKLGRVIVILKGNQRLIRKKGTILLDEDQRKTILESIRYISGVVIYDSLTLHHDDFSEALKDLNPDIYAAGADKKTSADLPQVIDTCNELGIEVVYGVGGDKISSSSVILQKYVDSRK